MPSVISITNLTKTYASKLQALKPTNLEIRKGEIFALLGPNGAGKTTLINIVCGIVTLSGGVVLVDGHDIAREYRVARSKIIWRIVFGPSDAIGKPSTNAFFFGSNATSRFGCTPVSAWWTWFRRAKPPSHFRT